MASTSARIEWDGEVAHVVARLHALSARLVAAYAGTVKGSPEHVGQQLKSGTFLADNEFLIDSEMPNSEDWADVIRAVKEWNGVTGVASQKLVALGANVVIGTRHEAGLAQSRAGIDGFYDVRDRAIRPLTKNLVRWVPRPVPDHAQSTPTPVPPAVAPPGPPPPPPNPDLAAINQNLQQINETLDRMSQGFFEFMRIFLGGDPRKRKRDR